MKDNITPAMDSEHRPFECPDEDCPDCIQAGYWRPRPSAVGRCTFGACENDGVLLLPLYTGLGERKDGPHCASCAYLYVEHLLADNDRMDREAQEAHQRAVDATKAKDKADAAAEWLLTRSHR